MSSYKELLAQREKLEKQIEEGKVARIRGSVERRSSRRWPTTALRSPNWAAAVAKNAKVGRPRAGVAPKYRDPDSGSNVARPAANRPVDRWSGS